MVNYVYKLTHFLKQKGESLQEGQVLHFVFLSPSQIQKLNTNYRGRNKITDILSFEVEDSQVLGELIFCPQVLKKQAKAQGWSFQKELSYLTLHGILHLLGYDHQKKEEAQKMYALQDELFLNLHEDLAKTHRSAKWRR